MRKDAVIPRARDFTFDTGLATLGWSVALSNPPSESSSTVVAAVTMGYGHLRAAAAIADHLGCGVAEVDRPPWASAPERIVWRAALATHTHLSRMSQRPRIGKPFRTAFEVITRIPPIDGATDRNAAAARLMATLVRLGFGSRLGQRMATDGSILVSTFYAPALAVDRLGSSPVACLVTDTEAHRVWAPPDPRHGRILFLAPTDEVRRRLEAYGVPEERIRITGFPLPPELAFDDAASDNLERRLRRLRAAAGTDPEPPTEAPRLTFAIGGAGAQSDRVRTLLDAVGGRVANGRLRLALVAGTDRRLARSFRRWVREAGVGGSGDSPVEVLHSADFWDYYRRFNRLLADTDVLWTKPSEMVFYAALGLPLVLDDPVGHHEWHNRRWIVAAGAGVPRPELAQVDRWLARRLVDGSFIELARAGERGLPRTGCDRISAALRSEFTDR